MHKLRTSTPLYSERSTNTFDLLMDDDVSEDDNVINNNPIKVVKTQLKNNKKNQEQEKKISQKTSHNLNAIHNNAVPEHVPNIVTNTVTNIVCTPNHVSHAPNPVSHASVAELATNVPDHLANSSESRSMPSTMVQNDSDSNATSLYVPPNVSDSWSSAQYNRRRKNNKYDRYKDSDQYDYNDDEIDRKDYPMLDFYDPTKKMPGDDLKLNSSWNVWIHDNDNDDWSLDSYTSIYTIDSIGSMWRFLSVFDNLDKNVRQYYIMRNGITPIWEDNNNKHGAICSIMIDNVSKSNRIAQSKGDLGVDAFSSICILVMNESFVRRNQDINGLCYSIKSRSVLIKLWVKDYESNKKYGEKLPITILKSFDSVISNMEGRGITIGGKSRISVQTKQIKPNY